MADATASVDAQRGIEGTCRALRLCALITLLAASLGQAGCFRYVPVQPTAVRPNDDVRLRITEDAALRLVRELGTYRGQLEGQLAPQGSDSLSISILIGQDYRGTAFENVRQTVPVGRNEVVEVRRRQLSVGRTVFASAAVLGGFVVLVRSIVQQENPNPIRREPPPPPPPGGFRIPFGWSP